MFRGLEALESRVLLSAAVDSDSASTFVLSEAAAALSVNPIWFEDLVPHSNGAGGYHAQAANGQSALIKDDSTRHEWLIQLTDDAALAAGSVAGVSQLLGLADIGVQVIRGLGSQGLVLVNDSGIAEGMSLVDYLAGNGHVSFLASNYEFEVSALPDDPFFNTLWGLHNTGQSGGRVDADIDAPEAWEMLKPSLGPEIIVAVIDTGVDYTHPDLIASMWVNPGEIPGNGIDDDGNGFIDDVFGYDFANNDSNPMDDHGHGTHVAGTIAATHNNGMGVAGVSPDALIMALKFMNASGNGSTANAIRAINYATMMNTEFGINVLVTNNSWGGGGFSRALYNAIAASGEAGIIFIASAGNDAMNIDNKTSYPASYNLDNIISVASTTRTDALSDFSNFGVVSVDIAAPGSSIRSTLPGGKYGYMSGTSMAAPHVAGAAALYLSQYPQATVADVKNAILQGAESINALRFKVANNARLNLVGMLNIKPTGSGSGSPPETNLPDDENIDPAPAPEPVLRPDLSLNLLSSTWQDLVVSGDKGKVTVELYNEGDLLASGKVQLAFYLSSDDQLDSDDTLVLLKSNVSVNIKAGQSKKLTYTLTIPPELLRGEYHILAMLIPGATINDSNSQNNMAVSESTHELVWMLGDVDGRKVKTLTIPDEQGRLMKLTYTGPGTITLAGDAGVSSVTVTGSTIASKLTITSVAKAAPATIKSVVVGGSIGSITASTVILNGLLNVQSGIRTLTLGQMDSTVIGLGNGEPIPAGNGDVTVVKLGHVTESQIIAQTTIKSLTVQSWLDEDQTADYIQVDAMGSLIVKGDMMADLTVTSSDLTLTAKISGGLLGSIWTIAGDIKTLSALQTNNYSLQAQGHVQSVSLNKKSDSQGSFFAQSFGTINVGASYTGLIAASGAKAGVSIKQLTAGVLDGVLIEAPGNISTFKAAEISNLDLTVEGSIGSFIASSWLTMSSIKAEGSIRSLSMSILSQSTLTAASVGTITVKNMISDVGLNLTDVPAPGDLKTFQLKSLSVAKEAIGLTLVTQGNIDKLSFGALTDSSIQVGVDGDVPADLEDTAFSDTGLIRSLTIKGLKGQAALPSLANSTILARQMGSVSLKIVDDDASLEEYGIVSTSVDKYSRKEGSSTFKLSKQTLPGEVDRAGRYALTIVA